jgi:hypothetical protein
MNNFWKGFFFIFGVLLLFILAFWLFNGGFNYILSFSGLNSRIQTSNLTSAINNEVNSFNNTFGALMINYTDFNYGFTVSYPKGYLAGSILNQSIFSVDNNTKFYALSSTPNYFPEVLSVDVLNSTAEDLYSNSLTDLSSIGLNDVKGLGKINNFFELTFDFSVNSSTYLMYNETVFGKMALFDCTTPQGNAYAAVVTFITPQITLSDLSLADYVFSNFKC